MKTAVVDAYKRIHLAGVKPGDTYGIDSSPDGTRIILTKLAPEQPRAAKVRLEERGGFTVLVSDRPIDEKAIEEALADFP